MYPRFSAAELKELSCNNLELQAAFQLSLQLQGASRLGILLRPWGLARPALGVAGAGDQALPCKSNKSVKSQDVGVCINNRASLR